MCTSQPSAPDQELRGASLQQKLQEVQQELAQTDKKIDKLRRAGQIFSSALRQLGASHDLFSGFRKGILETLALQGSEELSPQDLERRMEQVDEETAKLFKLLGNSDALPGIIAQQKEALKKRNATIKGMHAELDKICTACQGIRQQREALEGTLDQSEEATASMEALVQKQLCSLSRPSE